MPPYSLGFIMKSLRISCQLFLYHTSYILPKGTELRGLGLTGQSELNLVLSHINSSPCELLGNKSPLELTEFMYQDLYGKLLAFGVHPIEKDRIILKPYLLKQRNK